MKTAFFDCFGGACSEMLLAALIDAGAPFERLKEDLASMPLDGYRFEQKKEAVRGISSSRLHIEQTTEQPARFMREIAGIILKGKIPNAVQERALRIFHRLAMAEGKVAGLLPDQVLFGNGAIREILAVVGVSLAMSLLEISSVAASSIPLGKGRIETPRGTLPLPLPSVLELLKDVPAFDNGEEGEMIDPAGAAILATLCRSFGKSPSLTLAGQGYGAGENSRLLRVVVGSVGANSASDTVGVLETNIEDTNPQFYEDILEKLLEAGALDVFLSPVVMQGGRQGVKLSAMVPPDRQQACTQIIFTETTSVGIRYYQAERQTLDREVIPIRTDFGKIKVKVARQMGSIVNLMPDYSDCLNAARSKGVPLKQVWQAAFAGAFSQGQLVP